MTQELVRKFRKSVPESHRQSLDTRIRWLWNQRFGTIQTIYNESQDEFDRLAAGVFIQAVLEYDLNSIALIFKRIEGGAISDEEVQERASEIRI